MTHDIITTGIAALAEDTADGTLVNGVALGEDDITEGMSGKRTRWPAETLREAVDMLVGKPITKQLGEMHVAAEKTDDGVDVSPNVPLEATVGEVTEAKYEDGVGLMWQGEISDPEMAAKVEQGLAEVSPVLARDVEPVDGKDELFEATTVNGIRDLGLVSNGAAPSNMIETGAAAAMTAEALSAAWQQDSTETTGAESPAGADSTPGDDGPDGGAGQSTGGDGLTHMDPENITDEEYELLARTRQMDSPAVIEEQDAERLSEADELLSAADNHDDPTVVDESEYDALNERVETVRGVLEEALAERTDLKESTISNLPFEALAGEFENDDGEFDAEALVQSPETGTAETGPESNEALTDSDKDRIEQIDNKLDALGTAIPNERIEALRDEACELADVDDYDAALEAI